MGSRCRVLLCKSSSFVFLIPSFSSTQLGFTKTIANSRAYRMATEASASSSSVTGGDSIKPLDSAVNNGVPSSSSSSSASSAIDFLSLCHQLKTTKRAGWIRRNVKDPESIADHMYRMGLMGLIMADIPGIDRDKCIKMAIVHDIAEAIVGDITPSDGISKAEKSRREQEALDHMCKLLGGDARAKEIGELWMEYEENSTAEAKIVKDFDKVEMILQALEYENDQGKDLNEFFQSTAGKFQTELGKAWAAEIASRRRK
ncbi:HD domain-containing protein 2 [Melia azedarach]|uniref:HD domain-containing protein 2 n=1 Tax=Melia azedarach TaxID=155640 RepID=A0ACC1XFJ3_MELAZ|nr:HD domain-containing protein 2 [Melia azedarach]